jgi:drug/metabolite transporter (DMT)-like permease
LAAPPPRVGRKRAKAPLTAPSPNQTRNGILLMLLAILMFTAMDALAKGLVARYPTAQVVWVRFLGQLVIVALILNLRLPVYARTKMPRLHVLRAFFQLGATGFFFLSLNYIGLAEATALTDLNPVLITLGAALFLGERLGPRRIAGVLAAMIGAMVIIRPGLSVFTPAALLPLCCAVSYAAAALLTRKVGTSESAWTAMIWGPAVGTVALTLAAPFYWQPFALDDLPLLAVLAALGTGAQLCMIRSFSITEASVVAPFGYVGILLATLWGIVLYDEWPDALTLLGAAIIVAAGLYVWHRETRVQRR